MKQCDFLIFVMTCMHSIQVIMNDNFMIMNHEMDKHVSLAKHIFNFFSNLIAGKISK